jgi:hypothetical protein
MSYIKDSEKTSSQYNTIDKDDPKRSKSIENVFKDVGNMYMNQDHRSFVNRPIKGDLLSRYKEPTESAFSPSSELFNEKKAFHENFNRLHRISMQENEVENVGFTSNSKHKHRKSKMKFSKY